MPTHLETVTAIYEAFGRGDVATILTHLADPIAWDVWADNSVHAAHVPWLAPRTDRAGVGEFFAIVGQFQIRQFDVLSLVASGNQVVAEIVIDATVPGGARYRDEELHLWEFGESGQVVRFRHYVDTAKHIAAAARAAAATQGA